MPSKFADSPNLNPTLAPGLSDEARKAVNAAFDAISTWRMETLNASDKNLERVIDRLAMAARALGWPEEIVDSTRAQIEGIVKAQIQMMDQMIDAWEEQIKSPRLVIGDAIETKILSAGGRWPGSVTSQNARIQSLRHLHANRATMAKGMRGHDGLLGQSWWAKRLARSIVTTAHKCKMSSPLPVETRPAQAGVAG